MLHIGGHEIYDLQTTLAAVEEKFGRYLKDMAWINFGGGHHITRADYDIPRLERCIRHMPDVLEMPYTPPPAGAGKSGEKAYSCRLASQTCLAGDVIGEYSFDAPLKIGDTLVFEDMAIYSMVKNNTLFKNRGLQKPLYNDSLFFDYCIAFSLNFEISSKYFCPSGLITAPFFARYPIVIFSSDFNRTAQYSLPFNSSQIMPEHKV